MSSAVVRGPDDRDAFFLEAFGQLQRGLTTKLYDHPFRFFVFDDLPKMLPIDRLEIQLVGNVEIGGHSLGITVHHDGLEPAFLDGQQSMHAAVIELDALPDAVGARAEHDDLLFVAAFALVGAAFFESGIEIGSLGLELRGAGVDHFKDPGNAGRPPFFRTAHPPFRYS